MDSEETQPHIMYQPPSPIFDVPEFPSLRRVKPLPKRRRTSVDAPSVASHPLAGGFLPSILPTPPGPDATAEELIAHAEELSAQMALQSYYMPIVGGVQDFGQPDSALFDRGGASPAIDFGLAFGARGWDLGEQEEGDYVDHLPQPGNTKKRKVPANLSGSRGELDSVDGRLGGEEEPADRAIFVGTRQDDEAMDMLRPPSPVGGGALQRRGRMLPATLVGLQHKEMLKSRKRQLAAVLGALSHGDTLALDQALSAHYPLLAAAASSSNAHASTRGADWKDAECSPRARRRASRVARRMRIQDTPFSYGPALPAVDFTFVCHSTTSERLVATREEVAVLHARFEVELARQAAKAAEAAQPPATPASEDAPSKQPDRARQKARTGPSANQAADPAPDPTLGVTKSRGKKKKRSALANASNPHHLRNYVPSRLPNQGQINAAQAQANTQNYISPLPLRFLSAQIPSRRKDDRARTPLSSLVDPADEWICPFCEYQLFYGDEHAYRRALKDRKKILKRRRRARERAAAAASGNSAALDKAPKDEVDAEYEPELTAPAAAPKQSRAKGERQKEGDRGGDHAHEVGR